MSANPAADRLVTVRGPSAFGGGGRRFFTLTWLLAATDFKLNYFGTAFGYVWSLLRPLMLFAVLYVVFAKGLHIGGGIPHYPDILLLQIMLFQFFSEATTGAVGCVVARENIVRKMQFPRLAIPISVVLTSLFNLALNLVAVMIFFAITGVEPRLSWLLLPVIVAALLVLSTGVGLLLAALYVRFRDIAQIWGVMSLVIFYSSPILYPIEKYPNAARFVLSINPLAPLLELARKVMVDTGTQPSIVGAAGSSMGIIGPALMTLVLCALGAVVFIRAAPRIAEEL
jgi:ABC-2 type transport system permease protein